MYTIYRIFEDDYGCEERMDDQPEMVLVLLRDAQGAECLIRMEEETLLRMGLDEGSSVSLTEQGILPWLSN